MTTKATTTTSMTIQRLQPSPSRRLTPTTKPDYPLATCIVSGEPLDAMGGHVNMQYQGREVRFCCKGCVKYFNQEPAKYLTMLDKAAAGELPLDHDTTEHKSHDHGAHEH